MSEKSLYKIKIDTADRNEQSVSLFEGEVVIDEVRGSLDIVSEIKKILDKNKISIDDVVDFDANPGPGSFTGIKKGITVANVLNWALGIQKEVRPQYGSEPNIDKNSTLLEKIIDTS